MPRPKKWRRVCCMPQNTQFAPKDAATDEVIKMTVDEYETIRLIDYEQLTQEECAKQMDVARTTVQSIYVSARRKLAQCIVDGHGLEISGGDVLVCEHGLNDGKTGCGKPCCHRKCCNKQQ